MPSEKFPNRDMQGLDLLVLVSQRQAQLFHHTKQLANSVLSLALLSSHTHQFLLHSPRLPPLLAIRRTLPASSPGWLHRRRLASQWSKFTAVDADVIRSNRHLLFPMLPPPSSPLPGAFKEVLIVRFIRNWMMAHKSFIKGGVERGKRHLEISCNATAQG